jgi:ribonuclease P protein component
MLPRSARLRRDRDFQIVYRARRSWATPNLVLYVRFHSPPSPDRGEPRRQVPVRVGFVISKKTAKRAHDRNRLKRRLREICRCRLLPGRRPGRAWDALFVARAPAPGLDFTRLAADVETLGRQAGLL